MQELIIQKNGEDPTFEEIKIAGDAYWQDRDKFAKGSGYKPYMRWLEKSHPYVTKDGTLQTNAEFALAVHQITPKNSLTNDSNWVPMGPFMHTNTGSWSAGQGRVNSMTVDPNNPNTYYIGTPGGGAWKSTDAGINWTPLNDFITRAGSSAVAVDPNNSDIVYVGTGDDDAGDSPSIGLLKSTDGGATFSTTGLVFQDTFSNISEVYIDPTNSNKIIVSSSRGVYISNNAGSSFTRSYFGNVKDVKLKPGDPTIMYLSTNGDGFHKSTDGGNTWTRTTAGLPANMGRTVIAVTPANPNIVYLLIVDRNSSLLGLYRSVNSGNAFTKRDNGVDILESNQAWFDLALEVSPTNENLLFTGCLNVWRSNNGGTSFTRLNEWNRPNDAAYTHADIHQIRQFGTELFAMTDGGIYRSNNNGNSFTDLTETAQIGQFYRVAVGASSADIAGGLQDNGGYVRSNNSWKNFYGADGMEAGVDPSNSLVRYGFTQFGGGLYFTLDGSSLAGSINGPEQGNWITPLKTDSQGTIYAGYSRLYKITNNSFEAVSSVFSGNIDVLEIDGNDDNTIYIGIGSVLHRSEDAGVNFTPVEFFNGTIAAIEVNSNDSNVVYVSLRGSSGDVRKSTNKGNTFTDISYNLPNLGKNTLAHQPLNADDVLYVGTTSGVYKLDGSSTTWESFDNNLPNTDVRDLEINPNDGIITAATYGRGVWQSALPISLPASDISLTRIGTASDGISCTDGNVDIEVSNNGTSALNRIDVTYSINSAAPINQSFTVTIAPGATTTLTLTGINLITGDNELSVTATTTNDAFISNNSNTTNLLKNNTGALNVTYTFENENFLVEEASGGSTTWERGIPSAPLLNSAGIGTDNNVYATNLSGEYGNDVTSYLYTGCYDLRNVQQPILRFEMAFDLERNYDILYMEVSTDQGNSWNVLGNSSDANWYNSNRFPIGQNCSNCVGAQWTGTAETISTYSTSLNAYSNEANVIFRFAFVTDQSVTQEGAVIDNVVVTGVLSNGAVQLENQFSIYPNPSNGLFQITWNEPVSIDLNVYDLSGKLILNKKDAAGGSDEIDLSQVAQGVYFLNIKTENGSFTKKLIVH
jgi:hypothetical protein